MLGGGGGERECLRGRHGVPPSKTFIDCHVDTTGMPRGYAGISEVAGLTNAGRYDEAVVLLRREIKAAPNNANAWYNLGVIAYKRGNYRDATNTFAQATDIDQAFVDAWYNKGRALAMLGKNFLALRAFEKVLVLDLHDTDALAQRDLMLEKISHVPKGQGSSGTRTQQTQLHE